MKLLEKRQQLLILLGCLILFGGCGQGRVKENLSGIAVNEGLIRINVDTITRESKINYSDIFDGIEIIALETKEECLIGQVDQLEIVNDTIYILDSFSAKALFLFDLEGRFIRKIGVVGRGPGEFNRPDFFSIDDAKKQIYVLDRNTRRVLVFSNTGEHLKSLTLQGNLIFNQIVFDRDIILVDNLVRDGGSKYWLHAIDLEGNELEKWMDSDVYNKGCTALITVSNNFFKSSYDVKYFKPFSDTIFSIQDRKIKPFLTLESSNRATVDDIAELNKIEDVRELTRSFISFKKLNGISHYIENSKLISFEYRNERLTYSLFRFAQTGEMLGAHMVTDDYTGCFPAQDFIGAYNDFFVSAFDMHGKSLEKLIDNIRDNKIKLSKENYQKLLKVRLDDNPVLVLYKCKDRLN
ncbi:6-bladed beta-propeller [Puteibacter caeruleilacunae]|nr:6-bladed beta-propeller [Puteibacter caeruleilacunae]